MSNKNIEEYDDRGNLIYYKDYVYGYEKWEEFDRNNNSIYFKDSFGYECWDKHDENNNLIYQKYNSGQEFWWKWNNNKQIVITEQEFKQIERTKLYFNNKKISRFEIMDI